MNEALFGPVISRGEPTGEPILPYVYFAFTDQDWITFGQYLAALSAHIDALNLVIKSYGHPVYQEPVKEDE